MNPMRHIRSRILSGLLLLVPLAVTVFVIQFVFGLISTYLNPLFAQLVQDLPSKCVPVVLPVISLVVFLFVLYFVGLVTAFVIGRKLLNLSEAIILKIPLIKSVYSLTKQVVDVFSSSKGYNFRSVVIVEFPRPGFKAVGFVTGTIQDIDGSALLKVFIPTAPNPTTGFLELIRAEQVQIVNMRVEDAFAMLISGGVISPERIVEAIQAK